MQTWAFRWKNGGYNTVNAETKDQAIVKAKDLGKPNEYSLGKMTVGLEPDELTFSTDPAYLRSLDSKFYYCD